jgi:hypothetical protein
MLAPVGVQGVKASFDPHTGYPTDPGVADLLLLRHAEDPSPVREAVLYRRADGRAAASRVRSSGKHYKTIFTLYENPAFNRE